MDVLRTLVQSVCAAAILGSVLHLLCPIGPMRRVYKTATAAFFLCCIVFSVVHTDLSGVPYELDSALAGIGYRDGENLQQALNEQVIGQMEAVMRRAVETELLEMDVIPKRITLRAHAADNGRIEWEQMTILLPKQYRMMDADVKCRIKNMAGVMPEVVYVE